MRALACVLISTVIFTSACHKGGFRTIDYEAFSEGQKYWEAQLTKCADSEFGIVVATGEIVQFQGAMGMGRPQLVPKYSDKGVKEKDDQPWEPSEADRLNGLEWLGRCDFNPFKPFRVYQNGAWSQWYDPGRFTGVIRTLGDPSRSWDTYQVTLPMKKISGRWEINEGKPGPFKPIPCEQLPPPFGPNANQAVALPYVAQSPVPQTPARKRAYSKAQQLLDRIRKGEDFVKLARENSDDPGSRTEGGDLGYFSRGKMVPALEQAAFGLKPGDVSGIVESQYGYHIIKIEDRRSVTDPGGGSHEEVRARHILVSISPGR